jgi:hypothetical protein
METTRFDGQLQLPVCTRVQNLTHENICTACTVLFMWRRLYYVSCSAYYEVTLHLWLFAVRAFDGCNMCEMCRCIMQA